MKQYKKSRHYLQINWRDRGAFKTKGSPGYRVG
jgi:hypothetical protein